MANVEMVWAPADGTNKPGGFIHAADVVNIARGLNGFGVQGHTLTATVTEANMQITLPAFTARVPDGSGGAVNVSHAGGALTVTTADADDPRTDIVVLDSAGAAAITPGTPTTESGSGVEAPMGAVASDEIVLVKIRVAAGVTAITASACSGRSIDVSPHGGDATIGAILDGGGLALTSGEIVYVEAPFDCEITQFTLLADQSGSVTVRVFNDTYANYPPTSADDISNGGLSISTATKAQDSTLTSWTTAVDQGDILAFEVNGGATSITRVTAQLRVSRV